MTELKLCPFCGGEAFIKLTLTEYTCFTHGQCRKCGARGKTVTKPAQEYSSKIRRWLEASAAEAWNTREEEKEKK